MINRLQGLNGNDVVISATGSQGYIIELHNINVYETLDNYIFEDGNNIDMEYTIDKQYINTIQINIDKMIKQVHITMLDGSFIAIER